MFCQRNKMTAVVTEATNFFSKFKVQTDVLKCRKCHKTKDLREQILRHDVWPDNVCLDWGGCCVSSHPEGAFPTARHGGLGTQGGAHRHRCCPAHPGDHAILFPQE